MIEKLESRKCPDCGSIYASKEISKVSLGAVVQVNMCCENGHKWSEFYTLNYSGFWFMGKHYDSLGCEKAKEVNSSDSEVSS